MKRLLKLKTFALLAMFLFLVFTVSSCMVLPRPGKPGKGNRGKHKGRRADIKIPQTQSCATPWELAENVK